jgi:CRISPR/Cas system CSM-associated protein Csm2 small subunit
MLTLANYAIVEKTVLEKSGLGYTVERERILERFYKILSDSIKSSEL